MSDETRQIALYTPDGLEEVRRRVNTIMVDMVDRTVQSMDKMSRKLDEVEEAMYRRADPSGMTTSELVAYTSFLRDSFRLRQDFLRTLSGYDANVSKAPVQAADRPLYSEEQADALREEVLRRESRKSSE